jgi:hypothetical protein
MGILGFTFAYLAFAVLHFFEFVLALVVLGLYGQDLNSARQQHKYADSKWVSTYGLRRCSLSNLATVALSSDSATVVLSSHRPRGSCRTMCVDRDTDLVVSLD